MPSIADLMALSLASGQSAPDLVLPATIINAQNTAQLLTATAGSAIAVSAGSRATAAFQPITNTLNVALLLQASLDGVNWTTVGGNVLIRSSDGAMLPSIPAGATNLFTATVADFQFVRLSTPNSAITGSANIVVAVSSTATIVTLDNGNVAPASNATNPAGIVLVAATDTLLLASNPARRTSLLRNDSGQPLFVRLGGGATSATQYSLLVPTGTGIELPAGHTGAIRGFSTLAGAAPGVLMTELSV